MFFIFKGFGRVARYRAQEMQFSVNFYVFLLFQYLKTTNIRRMNKPYHNDQAHIAEEFHFIDEHTSQTARLAFFKINSYKLSLIKASFSTSREDMSAIIRSTLLNYTDPGRVLADLGFFQEHLEN